MKRLKLAVFMAMLCALSVKAQEAEYLQTPDVKIRYKSIGSGEPVILLHGFLENIEIGFEYPLDSSGANFLSALSEHYRVVAFDARGHGLSEKPLGVENYGRKMVADVVDLMNGLGIEQAHFFGYSMGALVAGQMLAEHPERVKSAILAGSFPLADQQLKDRSGLFSLIDSTAACIDNGCGLNPLLRWYWPGPEVPSDETLVALTNEFLGEQDLLRLKGCVLGFKDLWRIDEQKLVKADIPLHIILGASDPFTEFAHPFGNFETSIKIIEDASHFDILMQKETLDEVVKFLKSTNNELAGRRQ